MGECVDKMSKSMCVLDKDETNSGGVFMREKNYRFETLQLHVGQEKADSVTGSKSSANLSDDILRV